MFTRSIPLFTLFGFKVAIDPSWFILGLLIAWSLAVGLFPTLYPDLARVTYWWMGIAGALGLLLSIVIHEFSHSLVARRYDMPIKGITLFIFGGVAEMEEEPSGPKAEFWVAIIGPVTSIVLAGILYLVFLGSQLLRLSPAVIGVLDYLATLNFILAIFNMIPAFPLDGGRVLRAALWGWKGRYLWATRIASYFGAGFGILLIFLAVLSLFAGNFIMAMWWFLIGLFIRGAAHASYQQSVMHETLQNVPVRRLMTPNPVSLPADLTIEEAVETYFYRYYYKSYPVTEQSRLVGLLELPTVKEIPREYWPKTKVKAAMQPLSEKNSIDAKAEAAEALQVMMLNKRSRLLVTEGKQLLGVLSQTDILHFLTVRLDLQGEDSLDQAKAAGSRVKTGSTQPS